MAKPPKKSITYGPAPKHLVEAVRKELRRLIDLPDLDANLGQIGRFANQADDMLMCVKSPEAVMRDEHGVTVPGVLQSPLQGNAETYGAAILRQIIPAIQGYQKTQNESPVMLVHAIANARQAGMTDVAAELEKKLTGKALDGDRPVDSIKSLTEDYCLPALPSAPKKKNGKAAA